MALRDNLVWDGVINQHGAARRRLWQNLFRVFAACVPYTLIHSLLPGGTARLSAVLVRRAMVVSGVGTDQKWCLLLCEKDRLVRDEITFDASNCL